MLTPLNVNVPLPVFVTPPVPEIAPLKLVDVLSPPSVNVPEPNVTEPAPANDPIALLLLFKSKVPATDTAELAGEYGEAVSVLGWATRLRCTQCSARDAD